MTIKKDEPVEEVFRCVSPVNLRALCGEGF